MRITPFFFLLFLILGTSSWAQENGAETEQEPVEETETTETEEEPEAEESEKPLAKRNPRLDLPPPTSITYANQEVIDIQRILEPDHYEKVQFNNKEAIFIINEANIALTKGVAIIVGDAGRNSLSRYALSELVKPLNDYGWVTIMVPAPTSAFTTRNGEHQDTLPDNPITNPDAAPATAPATAPVTAPNDQTAAIESPTFRPSQGVTQISELDFNDHESQMLALMQEVVEYSSTYPGFFLVIAQGTSSAWLAKIYSEEKLPQPDALVAISPNWPERQYNKQLPEYIAQMEAPVLDVYNQWDNNWTKKAAKDRAIASERALKLHYRQRELIGQYYDNQQFIYLAKEIYGWLTYMGW